MLELRACGDLEVLGVLAYLDIRGGAVSPEIRKLYRSTQKGDAGNLSVVLLAASAAAGVAASGPVDEGLQHACELHWENELGCSTFAQLL